MRSRLLSSAGAGLLLAGCSGPGEDLRVGQRSSGIYYGAAESGEAWAVAVHYIRPGTTKLRLCTGSAIAPRAVLTAKHCIFDETSSGVWQSLPPSAFTVAIGQNVMGVVDQQVGVTELHTTPGDYTKDDALGGNDIAVLVLNADLATSPRPLSTLGPLVGDPLQIIGFGFTQTDQLGVKHSGTTSVSDVGNAVFESAGPAWTCSGDSGGPALHLTRGEILGVSSYGPAGCNAPESYYTRVDVHLQLIAQAVAASGGRAGGTGGASGCDRADPTCTDAGPVCDQAVDPGCVPPVCDSQTPCSSGMQCVAGACVAPDPGPGVAGSSDGGCAFRAPGFGGMSGGVLALLAFLFALRREVSARAPLRAGRRPRG
jgi:V8-like Glu-specific endopeptidase